MRWKIRDFVFCEERQTLTLEENTARLEPMMSELLGYFCRNQSQIISKEQLLDDVWQGRYVGDNTVSKLITKLRKALQDDARNPEFIVTVPKRGYRFIINAEQLEATLNTSETKFKTTSENTSKDTSKNNQAPVRLGIKPKLFLLTLGLFACATIIWLAIARPSTANIFVSAKAVTSDKGSEHFPSFAADGIRLAYMNHNGEKYRLYVKNIYSGEQLEISHGAEHGVGPAHWNSTGTQLVYLVASKHSCQYFTREFDGLVMSEPKLLYTCNAGSFGAIKFTHNDNLFIFAESAGMGKPYSLYSFDRKSGQVHWLPQPDLHLGGNSQFDLHPTENKLLISSPNEQQWEGFYQLDLNTQKLTLLFKLNAYICCGIWSHNGEHVVLMGEHPAREIVQYNLDGSNKSVVYTGAQSLHRPERHSNGVDYTFSAFNTDLNVDEYNISKQQAISILNDSFDERLAVLSPNAKQVAYISLTSGNEELWLYHRETRKKRKVTQFADGRHYLDLAWSPDEMQVAALTLNSIHIINLKTGNSKVLALPEKEYRGMSFKSASQIAFSMKLDSNWQVVVYNLNDDSMTRLDAKWQSVQYHKQPENWLWVDQAGQWYQGEQRSQLQMPKQNVSAFYGRQFKVKKSGEQIALYDWQQTQLEIYNIDSEKPVISLKSQVGHFSINGNIVLVSQNSLEANDSDIYQTYRVTTN